MKSIIENAARLTNYGEVKVAVKNAKGYLTLADNAKLDSLQEGDIINFDIAAEGEFATFANAVFNAKPDAGAVVFAAPKYLLELANKGVTIPPILDDFAQIVGATLKVAKNTQSISKAIKGRNGCMISGKGVAISGRTLDEAATALLVAEKAAKTYVLAVPLGGAKPVPMWEAKLMNYIYAKKYSKKDQDIKMSE